MLTRETLRGVWAGIPTPWDAAGRFDELVFSENAVRLCAAEVHGIYTTATTGEFYALDDGEFSRMVRVLSETTRGTGVLTQVGCTWTDTQGCIRRAQIAVEHGVDGLQTALPFWIELTDEEVVRFFADLSRACPDSPIIHYNDARAKRVLNSKLYRRIIAEVPMLIGTKQVTTDLGALADLFMGVPELNHFGSDWLLVPCMLLFGAKGTYSTLATVNPKLILSWFVMCERGEWVPALEIQKKLLGLSIEVVNPVNELGYSCAACDKAWVELSGFLKGSRTMKLPYATVPADLLETQRLGIMQRMPELLALS